MGYAWFTVSLCNRPAIAVIAHVPTRWKSVSFPKLEEEISRFWQQRDIYEKSLAARARAERFVFYEGPPTANGLPHPGHCLTRAMKDLFPRYKTMRGYLCQRKAGWDTHGLPVEVEVCKELGIHSKEEIEALASSRLSASAWRAFFATPSSGNTSPSGWASGFAWTRPTSPSIKATWKASGGR